MYKLLARPLFAWLSLVLLTACGGGATVTEPAATTPPVATMAASPPALAATEPTAAIAATALVAAEGPFAGLEQGRTPEGYQTLGSATAPVTLVMYSDFL